MKTHTLHPIPYTLILALAVIGVLTNCGQHSFDDWLNGESSSSVALSSSSSSEEAYSSSSGVVSSSSGGSVSSSSEEEVAKGTVKNIGNIKEHITGSNSVNFAFARNIWDMQLFGNRIYIGYGNWANSSLSGATNKGPIPIIAIDTGTDQFIREEVYAFDKNGIPTRRPNGADDEQLWRFRIINGKLFTPGTDARGVFGTEDEPEWNWGNFYVRQFDGTWLRRRTIPGGIHVLDIVGFNGKLYAGIGSSEDVVGSSGIMYSSDEGISWSAPANFSVKSRHYTLLEWGNSLYCFAGNVARRATVSGQPKTRLRGTVIDRNDTATDDAVLGIFDETLDESRYIVRKYAFVKDALAFILYKMGDNNDAWEEPAGLHFTSGFSAAGTISTVHLPNPSAEAIDIISRDNNNSVYILANVKNSNNYTVIVYKTTDFITFEECINFSFGTFARSFEEYNKNFYIGMGTMDGTSPSELAGTIVKVTF
jgi:hypothetical protein